MISALYEKHTRRDVTEENVRAMNMMRLLSTNEADLIAKVKVYLLTYNYSQRLWQGFHIGSFHSNFRIDMKE